MNSEPTGDPTGRIGLRTDGRVQWLTFDQPAKHNALSMGMVEQALDAVRTFCANAEQRVLVLAGGGDRAFVSGADLAEFDRKPDAAGAERRYFALGAELFEAVADCPKPTIAMIHGYCFGGGVALAAACDLRYAADDARFSIPAARLGLAYSLTFANGLSNWSARRRRAKSCTPGGATTARKRRSSALINRVYEKASLNAEVAQIAETISANAPLSIRATKQTIRHLLSDPAERDRSACDEAIAACSDSRDFAEGRAAFAEKRQPVFEGR